MWSFFPPLTWGGGEGRAGWYLGYGTAVSLASDSLPHSFPTVGGEIPLDMRLGGGQLVSEELMNLGESFIQTNDPSLKLFQCAVCNKFTTDNLDMLGLHMNVERSLPEDEWKAVMGDSYQCKLCRYNTQLKANFQLHCKTDKHVQKYQLVAHIKEGGKANEWRLKCVAIGNPVHLKCNACDYYTNSLEKLRLHTVNSRHEASLKLYKVRPRPSPGGAACLPGGGEGWGWVTSLCRGRAGGWMVTCCRQGSRHHPLPQEAAARWQASPGT